MNYPDGMLDFMIPTHISTDISHTKVTAWRYLAKSSIPLWVVNNFHDLGDGRLTHRSGYGVPEGDWIVMAADNVAIVLTDPEFQRCFTALPR